MQTRKKATEFSAPIYWPFWSSVRKSNQFTAVNNMVLMTMIARLHDGLPLAASVQDHDQVSSSTLKRLFFQEFPNCFEVPCRLSDSWFRFSSLILISLLSLPRCRPLSDRKNRDRLPEQGQIAISQINAWISKTDDHRHRFVLLSVSTHCR